MSAYEVTLYGTRYYKGKITVSAADKQEANEKALETVKKDKFWIGWSSLNNGDMDISPAAEGPKLITRGMIDTLPSRGEVDKMDVLNLLNISKCLLSGDNDLSTQAQYQVNDFMTDVARRLTQEYGDLLKSGRIEPA